MDDRSYAGEGAQPSSFFYGWYIVGVGILVNIAGTFAFSSTLSIFLKPITEELGVSRGAFSLIRTFEIGVAALIVPLLGPWIDRHGGRGVLVLGVLMEGTGLLLSGLVQSFWQFVLVRCSLVIAGEALLGSLVINVTIAQWFVRKRGRAMGIANLGTGVAKFTIPLCAASLFVLVGWRSTWAILMANRHSKAPTNYQLLARSHLPSNGEPYRLRHHGAGRRSYDCQPSGSW